MAKILIVEDSDDINRLLCEVLTKEGHTPVSAFSGTEGLLRYQNERFDLVLLDLMLPGKSGTELIREMKETPVIVLTAIDELDSKIKMLTQGAEDYITKPFEIAELLARVAVQLRRSAGAIRVWEEGEEKKSRHGAHTLGASENVVMQGARRLLYKDLILDIDAHQAYLNGKELSLTKQEFKILELLMSNPGRAFTKQNIYDYAWEDHYIGEDKTINVHVSNIRKKVKAVSEVEYIETVWGIGFRMTK